MKLAKMVNICRNRKQMSARLILQMDKTCQVRDLARA
jgi:hypothetical protein